MGRKLSWVVLALSRNRLVQPYWCKWLSALAFPKVASREKGGATSRPREGELHELSEKRLANVHGRLLGYPRKVPDRVQIDTTQKRQKTTENQNAMGRQPSLSRTAVISAIILLHKPLSTSRVTKAGYSPATTTRSNRGFELNP